MSCTWTIFEGEKSLRGVAQKEETTVKEFVRMACKGGEEGGNGKFNYRQSKRRKGKYGARLK